ncbi:MAG: TauD/TfdA family dioxygenase [Gammaproteobacteria bacterium]
MSYRRPSRQLEISTQPGDMLVMDNQRVLHGRTEFDPTTAERHLQTCAVERDDFHNNYRRLARELNSSQCKAQLSWRVI